MTTFYVTREGDLAGGRVRRRRPAPRRLCLKALAAALAAGFAAACAGSPTRPTPTPPPPTPDAPTLTCEADVTLTSLDGMPVPHTVKPPTVEDGAPPVGIVCNAPDTFPVGTTAVACTATDALGQQGTCSTMVTVEVPPVLPVTDFLAFGDSLTAGEVKPAQMFAFVDPLISYPYRLQGLFAQRYLAQTILVENSGVPGESAIDQGMMRLNSEIHQKRPDVVLLMEGTNDLGRYTPRQVAAALDGMTRDAYQREAIVFLATLPPVQADLHHTQAERIPELNVMIKGIAGKYRPFGVYLVDVYAPLAADLSLMGPDGLHPTVEGYAVMAQTWFDAIVAALDPDGTGLRRSARRR